MISCNFSLNCIRIVLLSTGFTPDPLLTAAGPSDGPPGQAGSGCQNRLVQGARTGWFRVPGQAGSGCQDRLVQGAMAAVGPTQAGDLLVFDGELVVIGDLLADGDGLPGVDDDLLLGLHRDDLSVAVGLRSRRTVWCVVQ